MIERAIITRLLDSSALTGLVANRVFPIEAPQDAAMPYVTVRRTSTDHIHHMGGGSGFAFGFVQVDNWGESYIQAKQMAEHSRLALQAFRGVIGTDDIARIFIENEDDLPELPKFGGEKSIHVVSQDYKVAFRETIPS